MKGMTRVRCFSFLVLCLVVLGVRSSNDRELVDDEGGSSQIIKPEAMTSNSAAVSTLMAGGVPVAVDDLTGARCEEIRIPMCKGIGYNHTSVPNVFHHETQEEAALEAHQFWPLIQINCSQDLQLFLCSLYAPICMEEYPLQIPACRSVCENAKEGCLPTMTQYGFNWPQQFECDSLPRYGDPQRLCMDRQEGKRSKPAPGPLPGPPPLPPNMTPSLQPPASRQPTSELSHPKMKSIDQNPYITPTPIYRTTSHDLSTGSILDQVKNQHCKCSCQSPFISLTGSTHAWTNNLTSVGGVSQCAYPCKPVYFSPAQRDVLQWWITLSAGLATISTSMTVLTFCVDSSRFQYPERAIIFLSFSYLMVSLGYLLRLWSTNPTSSSSNPDLHSTLPCDGNLMLYPGSMSHNQLCTLTFLLTYYFGHAASIWWVVLTLSWFMAAGLKWGTEAIIAHEAKFHLLAWLIPAGMTIVVLSGQAVDGDQLSGLCTVGAMSAQNETIFQIYPLIGIIALGSAFLGFGFVSLCRIRSVIRATIAASNMSAHGSGTIVVDKSDRLERLMCRIGLFSLIFILPSLALIVISFQEYATRPVWEAKINCQCSPSPPTSPIGPAPLPYLHYLVKNVSHLAVGVTSALWIISWKTWESWKRFFCRMCGCGTRSSTTGSTRSGQSGTLLMAGYHPAHHQHLQHGPPSIPNPHYTPGSGSGGGGPPTFQNGRRMIATGGKQLNGSIPGSLNGGGGIAGPGSMIHSTHHITPSSHANSHKQMPLSHV